MAGRASRIGISQSAAPRSSGSAIAPEVFMNNVGLGACPSNPKIGVWESLFTPNHREIVNPEPIVCVENFHL